MGRSPINYGDDDYPAAMVIDIGHIIDELHAALSCIGH